MNETVFFAWQSDLPSEVNRRFIRQAIDKVVAEVNASLASVEALRPTEATQDVAGDINVAETIFAKIDSCRIFVADVTTVTPPKAKRPAPNPNVMVEYGRASVRPGSERVVTVFNSAFGDWRTERPFDLRHRRMPVVYNLPLEHSSQQRESVQRKLVAELVDIFKAMLASPTEPLKVVLIQDFEEHRQRYEGATFDETKPPRTPGFWCAAIPASRIPTLSAPWKHQELVQRESALNCRLENQSRVFRTIDSNMWMRGYDRFEPRSNAGCRIHRYKYPDGLRVRLRIDQCVMRRTRRLPIAA